MSNLKGAPEWATSLSISFESGASGQFILYGNVHDRLAFDGQLMTIERYIPDVVLAQFDVVFSYDLGNGLTVERGVEKLTEWIPAAQRNLSQGPPPEAMRLISRYARFLANLRALGKSPVKVAVIVRGADQLLPAGG